MVASRLKRGNASRGNASPLGGRSRGTRVGPTHAHDRRARRCLRCLRRARSRPRKERCPCRVVFVHGRWTCARRRARVRSPARRRSREVRARRRQRGRRSSPSAQDEYIERDVMGPLRCDKRSRCLKVACACSDGHRPCDSLKGHGGSCRGDTAEGGTAAARDAARMSKINSAQTARTREKHAAEIRARWPHRR